MKKIRYNAFETNSSEGDYFYDNYEDVDWYDYYGLKTERDMEIELPITFKIEIDSEDRDNDTLWEICSELDNLLYKYSINAHKLVTWYEEELSCSSGLEPTTEDKIYKFPDDEIVHYTNISYECNRDECYGYITPLDEKDTVPFDNLWTDADIPKLNELIASNETLSFFGVKILEFSIDEDKLTNHLENPTMY